MPLEKTLQRNRDQHDDDDYHDDDDDDAKERWKRSRAETTPKQASLSGTAAADRNWRRQDKAEKHLHQQAGLTAGTIANDNKLPANLGHGC